MQQNQLIKGPDIRSNRLSERLRMFKNCCQSWDDRWQTRSDHRKTQNLKIKTQSAHNTHMSRLTILCQIFFSENSALLKCHRKNLHIYYLHNARCTESVLQRIFFEAFFWRAADTGSLILSLGRAALYWFRPSVVDNWCRFKA